MEAKFYKVMKVGNVVEVTTRESGKLAFQTHEYNDQVYQDITAKEIIRIKA